MTCKLHQILYRVFKKQDELARYVKSSVRTRNTQKFLVGKSEERDKLEDLGEDGMMT